MSNDFNGKEEFDNELAEELAEEEDSEDIDEGILEHVTIIEIVEPQKKYPVGLPADMVIKVSCPEGCDLGGGMILIGDADDKVVSEQRLMGFTGEETVNTTEKFSVQIPTEPGDYTWTIIFYPSESDLINSNSSDNDFSESELSDADPTNTDPTNTDFEPVAPGEADQPAFEEVRTKVALHATSQTEYSFQTVEHITGMSIWRDSVSPVPIGDEYQLHVGISCIHGCTLLGQEVNLYHKDALLATAVMEEPLPPYESLYQNKIALTAPNELGSFVLECRFEPEGLDLLHKSNTHRYSLTTSKHAQCRLDLIARSAEDDSPLPCAVFIVRPKDGCAGYVRTDKDGKASIGLPWGDVHVEVNCDERRDVQADITLPEGQETYELTLAMPWEPLQLD